MKKIVFLIAILLFMATGCGSTKNNSDDNLNRCGFKIVEFFNPKHKDPHQISETSGNIPKENNYFCRFEKEMK